MAATTKVELEEGEYALVIGQDGNRMSVRIEGSHIEEEGDLPVPVVLVMALAQRLLNDPDFHDEMLEWYEDHDEEEEGTIGTA